MKEYRSNYLGAHVKVQKWTESAIDCYERNCKCEGCFYNNFFKSKKYGEPDPNIQCKMKATVIELIRVFGIPQKTLKDIIDDE